MLGMVSMVWETSGVEEVAVLRKWTGCTSLCSTSSTTTLPSVSACGMSGVDGLAVYQYPQHSIGTLLQNGQPSTLRADDNLILNFHNFNLLGSAINTGREQSATRDNSFLKSIDSTDGEGATTQGSTPAINLFDNTGITIGDGQGDDLPWRSSEVEYPSGGNTNCDGVIAVEYLVNSIDITTHFQTASLGKDAIFPTGGSGTRLRGLDNSVTLAGLWEGIGQTPRNTFSYLTSW